MPLSPSKALHPSAAQLGPGDFHDDESFTSSQLPPTAPKHSPKKQRGMYSETLLDANGAANGATTNSANNTADPNPNTATTAPHTRAPPLARVFPRPELPPPALHTTLPSFALRAIEPKVQVPFQTAPNTVPRKIEIERLKRLYASTPLQTLLLAANINYDRPPAPPIPNAPQLPLLPITKFDDASNEIRSVDAWLEQGRIEGRYVPPREETALSFVHPAALFAHTFPSQRRGLQDRGIASDRAGSRRRRNRRLAFVHRHGRRAPRQPGRLGGRPLEGDVERRE